MYPKWFRLNREGREYLIQRKAFRHTHGLIDVLIKAYDQAESWQTKRQILSLFANDFSCRELQTLIPGLTKWRIDQARQHTTEAGKGQAVPEQTSLTLVNASSFPLLCGPWFPLELSNSTQATAKSSSLSRQAYAVCLECSKFAQHRCRGPFMGLIISQQKGLKHLTTCAQLSTL